MNLRNDVPRVADWVTCDGAGTLKILLPKMRPLTPISQVQLWAQLPGTSESCCSFYDLSAIRVLGGLQFGYSDSPLLLLRTQAVLYFYFFAAVRDTCPLRVKGCVGRQAGRLHWAPHAVHPLP